MAAINKQPSKIQLDWSVDREAYNNFVRAVQQKGFAPQVVVEKMMKKYCEGGIQI